MGIDQNKVTFHYIKDPSFRTSVTTGAIGGLTIHRLININFYIDRTPIPQSITNSVNQDGTLGNEVNRDSKQGVVREVQFGLEMDVRTAKDIIDFLQQMIIQVESIK